MLKEGLKSEARENKKRSIPSRGNSQYKGLEVPLHGALRENSTALS